MPFLLVFGAVACSLSLWIVCGLLGVIAGWDSSVALWLTAAVGAFYLPMALIAVALFETGAGLSPVTVVRGITRTMPGYLVCAPAVAALGVATWFAVGLVSRVPVVGAPVAAMLLLYALMAAMRILGLLYRTHAKCIGWFE